MTEPGDEVLLRFDEPRGRRSVVLEDDGRVAYAYLVEGEAVIGDVWLYNVQEAPESVNWRDRTAMPFCNPGKYCSTEVVPRLGQHSKVSCLWCDQGVTISVDGVVLARLEEGSRPGWSRMAQLAGPLAKPLVAE